MTAHPNGVQHGLGDACPRDLAREGQGERGTGQGGDGFGVGVDVLVAEVEGGGGYVHGLVRHAAGRQRGRQRARKRAFLQQSGGREGLRDPVYDVGVEKVRCFVGHLGVFICAQK